MGIIDQSTPQRGYPLPNIDNPLEADEPRLLKALQLIDADVVTALGKIAQLIDAVTALQTSAGSVDARIKTAVDGLLSGAPGALDTLNELATALGNDAQFSKTVATALAARLRFDADQALTTAQQAQGRKNLAAAVTGSNADITELTGLSKLLKAPGVVATAWANGFAQIVARSARYGVGIHNNDTDAYLLQTAVNNPDGTFNGFRPFSWNLATGFVSLDSGGSGARFGGSLNVVNTLAVGGSAAFSGYATFGVGARFNNDVNITRGDNSGYITLGTSATSYLGFDYSNVVLRSSGNIYMSAAGGSAFINGATVWHSANFNPNAKITGDFCTVVGYNNGNYARPYISGGPGYHDLVYSNEGWGRGFDAAYFPSYGRSLYAYSPEENTRVFACATIGNHFLSHYWNGSDVITQVDGTGFTIQRVGQSDERLKDVDGDLSAGEAVEFVRALRPSVYAFKEGLAGLGALSGRRFGFIAQHLQKLRGTLVRSISTTVTESGPGPEYLHLEQDTAVQIIAALTTTVQNVLDRLDALEASRA